MAELENSVMARLFWPRELRESIAEYREAGTLNETAVIYLGSITTGSLSVMLILALLVLLVGEPILGTALFVGALFVARFGVWSFYNKQMKPYISGTLRKVRITKSGVSVYGALRAYGKSIDSSKTVKIEIRSKPNAKDIVLPIEGSELDVYAEDKDKAYAMPNYSILRHKFSIVADESERADSD